MTATVNSVLSDMIQQVRRIVKTPSNQALTDETIVNYIDRFYLYEMPERIKVIDLKRQWTFAAITDQFIYDFPLNTYNLIRPPVYVDGVEMDFYMSTKEFYTVFPETVQNDNTNLGDGSAGTYNITVNTTPFLKAYVDHLGNRLPYVIITAINAAGTAMIVVDDGTGVLHEVGTDLQNQDPDVNAGTVNYTTGAIAVNFSNTVPSGNPITVITTPYASGKPSSMLFYDNYIKLYPVPDRAYKIQVDADITPTQYFNEATLNTGEAAQFNWMSEYLARGAARKILSDTGDEEQFRFFEPLFKEQELLVLRRTNRQQMTQRTPTIFSGQTQFNPTWERNY